MSTPQPADGAGTSSQPLQRTLPEKIEYLFATIRPPGPVDRAYTVREISQRAEDAGHSISHSHIHQLRRDPGRSPTVRALEALAAGFGVSVAYFFNDETAARVEEDLELIAALRDQLVRDVALHASGLSGDSLASIMQMIDRARQWEGLGTTTRADPTTPPDPPS